MPNPKRKERKKRKPVSGQEAADRIEPFFGFRMSERQRGVNTKSSLRKSRKELAIGVKPSSRFKGGLSGAEKGFLRRLRKGKKT